MKSIYFHIDELSRDSVVASALKRKLKNYGILTFYGNRNISELFRKFPFPFDLAIFPSVDIFESSFLDPSRLIPCSNAPY